jgi:pSer/pThr/pTyr-binding forkhead associated (FHA) protein
LRDLGSPNGTFVRVRQAVLKEDAEIMIARNRFRFVAAEEAEAAPEETPPEPAVPDIRSTMTWRVAETFVGGPARPSLLELHAGGEGRRLPLVNDSLLVGRDSRACQIVLDPWNVSARHARIYRDDQDRWHIEDLGSLNGVWLRITEIPLTNKSAFLLGEQLFALALP